MNDNKNIKQSLQQRI